jgi:hypothetical protein
MDDITINWDTIGLTLNIVGAFFIVNSLVFKRPRRFLHDYFGVEKRRPLSTIRNHVMSQVQLVIGFVFLISGYFLSLAKNLADEIPDRDSIFSDPGVLTIAAILIVSMLAVTLILKICQILWTKWTFRQLLIDFFRDHPAALDKHPAALKEVGEILGVDHYQDDSVADYSDRLRKVLELPPSTARPDRLSEASNSGRNVRPTPPPEPAATRPHPATPPRIVN